MPDSGAEGEPGPALVVPAVVQHAAQHLPPRPALSHTYDVLNSPAAMSASSLYIRHFGLMKTNTNTEVVLFATDLQSDDQEAGQQRRL